MAAGDVTVNIIASPFTAADIDTALTALRAGAGLSGHYLMTACENQIVLAAIEE